MMADETSIQICEICPTLLTQHPDKHYRKTKGDEFKKVTNALYNSGGGTLILRYDKSSPPGHVKKCVGILEQKILEFLGPITVTHDININILDSSPSQAHGEIEVIVKTSTKSAGINAIKYNIYLPSKEHVTEVPPLEREKLKSLLNESIPLVEPIKASTHHRHFVWGEHVSFDESKTVQFKYVKHTPERNVTFADRVVAESNKFACCVSAFANFRGGYIYVGIKDDGKVEGESVDETEKQKVKKNIRKVVNRMIWPEKSERADENEDKRWDIYFEPVRDSENNIIQDLYVVVVFVAQCRGGVFVEVPVCYEIIDNKIKKVDFASWRRRIDLPLTEEGTCSVSATCDSVYEKLTNLLNNNCNGDELEKASETIQKEYNISENEVKLHCLSKLTSFHARRGEYGLAETCLRDHRKIRTCCSNQMRLKVTEEYLSSVVKRCKGEYEESYKILKESLSDLQKLPIVIMSVLFYAQIATLENILAMKTKDLKTRRSLIDKAEKNYDIASSYLKQNRGGSITKANYLQKIYINKAMLYLGCSLSGDILDDSDEFININKAKDYLLKTQEIIHDGYPLCKFRKIQNLLAQACLSYRLGNNDPTQQIQNAVNYSTEAAALAVKCKFAEMQTYAEKYKKFFESKFEK